MLTYLPTASEQTKGTGARCSLKNRCQTDLVIADAAGFCASTERRRLDSSLVQGQKIEGDNAVHVTDIASPIWRSSVAPVVGSSEDQLSTLLLPTTLLTGYSHQNILPSGEPAGNPLHTVAPFTGTTERMTAPEFDIIPFEVRW